MLYTKSHTWILLDGEEATIGITAPFESELDEIVYIELPRVGYTVSKDDEVAVLESTKAAIDMTTPLSGTITEVNEELRNDPGLLSCSPEKEGWIFKLKVKKLSELDSCLDIDSYQKMFTSC